MTKTGIPEANSEEEMFKFRNSMMSVMSEVSFNPANVIPSKQEELASFMVNELRSFVDYEQP